MEFFLEFWNQLIEYPLLFLPAILTLGVILVNGWTDAPNAIATCVVTRCMSARAAVLMAAVFNFLGVFVMMMTNATVAETITKMVSFGSDPQQSIPAISAAMLSIVIWATLAWVFGIPTSESHALIAGLTGSAIALNGFGIETIDNVTYVCGVNLNEWGKVLIGIIVSVVLGFGLGWLICKLVTAICYNMNRPKTEPFFRGAQIVGAAAMAFMHGAQDGLKFLGILVLCYYLPTGGTLPKNLDIWELWILVIICSVVMAAGTAIGGKKIIKSVGMDMVKLEKYQGFSADIASTGALLFCSSFGIPVSTTHVKTTSIMGVGAVKKASAINLGVVKEMVLTWVLTFPGCGLLSFVVTHIFLLIF
ncbi:MAG: inorganic phosphate transporter [Clostridia bacterium]|nr:inorganic phosphate transporter [Clostridia bacterium]